MQVQSEAVRETLAKATKIGFWRVLKCSLVLNMFMVEN